MRYEKDITSLNKNSANGPQNIIDPYNLFLYPLDYFVAGSEYATAFVGNFSRFAANTTPQNYHDAQASFTYGITDHISMGAKGGYRSSNHLHHFSLRDQRSRFYRFQSYYFFDFFGDCRLTKNSLISINAHFVPHYKTYLDYPTDQQGYESKNRYIQGAVALTVLF